MTRGEQHVFSALWCAKCTAPFSIVLHFRGEIKLQIWDASPLGVPLSLLDITFCPQLTAYISANLFLLMAISTRNGSDLARRAELLGLMCRFQRRGKRAGRLTHEKNDINYIPGSSNVFPSCHCHVLRQISEILCFLKLHGHITFEIREKTATKGYLMKMKLKVLKQNL